MSLNHKQIIRYFFEGVETIGFCHTPHVHSLLIIHNYVAYTFLSKHVNCCLSTAYKKGQKGKKEASEQKRKDKEKKNGTEENDKSREEEEDEEEHMEDEQDGDNEGEEEDVEN